MIVLEPLSHGYEDEITRWNELYPLSKHKPNARYIGEVYKTSSVGAVRDALEPQNIRFVYPGDQENGFYCLDHLTFTFLSDFTYNRVGLRRRRPRRPRRRSASASGSPCRPTIRRRIDAAAELQAENGIGGLVLGLDHMATRILAGEREDAILEYLTMVPYYFWGAYNITEMNSSTNVTRNPNVPDDKMSPARVFTANNTPSFVNSFDDAADADRGLRPQLRAPHAPHGRRGDRRPRRRREERRLRRAPALRDGHRLPRPRRRRVQGRAEPQADLLQELRPTRC